MTVELWIGSNFETSHERQALDQFMKAINARFHQSEDLFLVLANFYLFDVQVDLTVITRDAIIAIELKKINKPFHAPMNGDWKLISTNEILGTAGKTPYEQARRIRGKFIDFLDEKFATTIKRHIDTRKVTCMVCVTPSIANGSVIEVEETTFFKITGLDLLPEVIKQQYSGFGFTESEMRQLVKLLNLTPTEDPVLSHSFIVPFESNPHFVGREKELREVHAALQDNADQKPLVITGMGGVGKTQLAIEYAILYRGSYPQGIFWIDAASDLQKELADMANQLELPINAGPEFTRQKRLARAFLERVDRCPDALVIFDNVVDFERLLEPINYYTLAKLKCHILVTTIRKPDGDDFRTIELQPLSNEDSLHIFLSENLPSDSVVRPGDTDHINTALEICDLLGNLPLAIALSKAYLMRYREISLEGYLQRIRSEGVLAVDHLGVSKLSSPTRHDAVVSATISIQWNAVRNKNAARIMETISLQEENRILSLESLSLFTGLPALSKPGYPSPLSEALKELAELSLVELLPANKIRVHPLIHAYIKNQTINAEEKILDIETNVVNMLSKPGELSEAILDRGVDDILNDLYITTQLLRKHSLEDLLPDLDRISRLINQESPNLRNSNMEELSQPYIVQQLRNRAMDFGWENFVLQTDAYIFSHQIPCLLATHKQNQEHLFLEKTLEGHNSGISGLSFHPDGQSLISSSYDGEIRIWDFQGAIPKCQTISGGSGWIDTLLVSPDGSFAVTIKHGDEEIENWVVMERKPSTIDVWDLKSNDFLFTIEEDHWKWNGQVTFVAANRIALGTLDHHVIIYDLSLRQVTKVLGKHQKNIETLSCNQDCTYLSSGSSDGTIFVWSLVSLELIMEYHGPETIYTATLITDDLLIAWVKNSPKQLNPAVIPKIGGTTLEKYENFLQIWKLPDGRLVRSIQHSPTLPTIYFEWHSGNSTTISGSYVGPYNHLLSISGNSRWVLAHEIGGQFLLYDLHEDQEYDLELRLEPMDITFTSDSENIIFGGSSESETDPLTLYNINNDRFLQIGGHASNVSKLAFCPRRPIVASGAEFEEEIKIWLLKSDNISFLDGSDNEFRAEQIKISSNGERVGIYDGKYLLKIYELDAFQLTQTIHLQQMMSTFWFPMNSSHIRGQTQNSLVTYDIETGELVSQLDISFTEHYGLRVHEINSDFFIGFTLETFLHMTVEGHLYSDHNPIYHVWNIDTQKDLYTFEKDGSYWAVTTKNGGSLVIYKAGTIFNYDIISHELLSQFEVSDSSVKDIVVTQDGRYMILYCADQSFIIRDLSREIEITRYQPDCPEISSFSVSEDCQHLAFITSKGLTLSNPIAKMTEAFLPGSFKSCQITPKGDYLVVIDVHGYIGCFQRSII